MTSWPSGANVRVEGAEVCVWGGGSQHEGSRGRGVLYTDSDLREDDWHFEMLLTIS